MVKRGGVKISKVKRKNIMSQKLRVRKKARRDKKKLKDKLAVREQVNIGEKVKLKKLQRKEDDFDDDTVQQMLEMMDEDDVEYVAQQGLQYRGSINIFHQAVIDNSLTVKNIIRPDPLDNESNIRKRTKKPKEDVFPSKCVENYEKEITLEDQPKMTQTKFLLPIKTKDGIIIQCKEEALQDDREVVSGENSEGKTDNVDENISSAIAFLNSMDINHTTPKEEALEQYKIRIGTLATAVLEEPEEKVRNLKILLEALQDTNLFFKEHVHKLLAVSLLEIFNDLLPSYELNFSNTFSVYTKLKKDTKKLIDYETSLLSAYKLYLRLLKNMTKPLVFRAPVSEINRSLGLIALHCMSELVRKNPEFNFSKFVIEYLSIFLNSKFKNVREEVHKGLGTIFKEDRKGVISLAAVRRIRSMVKSNKFVHVEVVSVLLSLRLKNVNLETEKAVENKERILMKKKRKVTFTSRKDYQRKKRLEELEKQLLETKAEENKTKTHGNFTEIAKCVFTIVFSVLKLDPTGKIVGTILEVLSKFGHCLNYEFFQDIVNIISSILETNPVNSLQRLHCVETVFAILSGEGEVLNIDPVFFYTQLYQCVMNVIGDNKNEETLVMLRTLETALIKRWYQLSLQKMFAFIKRLCTVALYLNYGNSVAVMDVVRKLMKLSKKNEILLDNDVSMGTGVYQPELPEPEYCCANATTLWELNLLCLHFHPYVRRMASMILNPQSTLTVPEELSKLSPADIAQRLDSHQMSFQPAVPLPPQAAPKRHTGKLIFTDDEFTQYLENVENSVCDPLSLDVASECKVLFDESDEIYASDENICFTDHL